MAFHCSLSCLHYMAASLFSHRRCTASTETTPGSRSHDFLQVDSLFSHSLPPSMSWNYQTDTGYRIWPYCPHSFDIFALSSLILVTFLSDRELSKKAQKANNQWWRLSGLLGDQNRLFMYILLQAMFTVATTALTVPIFLSYELHLTFQVLKVSATVWNGGNFLLEVMPRQVILKEKKKTGMQSNEAQFNQSALENTMKSDNSSDVIESVEQCTTTNKEL